MSETTDQPTAAGRRHIIERPRLTRLLDEASAQVILLIAPAGYGKTTLARQWLSNRPNAWLQASEASSDVVALALDLAKALATLDVGTNRRLLERVRTVQDPRRELRALAELQAESLRPWPGGSWLAIDDYEYIAQSNFAEEYIRLLLHESDVRLLVAGRVNPVWATPRALLYGDIYAVDRGDLTMREPEVRAILRSASESRVTEILTLADGWPALIGLASLTNLAGESVGEPPSTLFEYFADELFRRGSRALQSTLPPLALAPCISPELASSMFGPKRGPELLREAEMLGFFSATAPDLNLHPLLKRFLLTRLPSGAQIPMATKLIQFYLARHDWDSAFKLIRQFKVPEALIQLSDAAYAQMLSSGRTATLKVWLRFAGELGTLSPVFDVIRAELALRDGNITHAEQLALRVVNSTNSNDYAARALTIAGRCAHLNNRESDALSFFRSAIACARTDSERHEATWGCLLSAEAFEEDEDLLATLEEFLEHRPESADDVLRAANARLIVAFAFGGVREASELAVDALTSLDHALDPLIRTSFLNNLSGALSLQARYAESGSYADQLIDDAQSARLEFVLPHAYVARAVALIGMGTYSEAEMVLKQAEHLAVEIGDRHNIVDARNVLAKLSITTRDYRQALRLLRDLGGERSVTATMSAELLATRGLAHASIGNAVEARAALSRAARLSSFPEIRALIACARSVLRLRETRDAVEAVEGLGVALNLSIVDPVVTVCRAFPELAVASSARYGRLASLADDVCSRTTRIRRPVQAGHLTNREKEVLRLISLGYTNREIAGELVIAEVTAKVHVRNIIRKLGVRSRTEAAIVALRGTALGGPVR